MRTNGMLIAIDGTAGTGKSTVGKAIAAKLGYGFLSTGEMYRALAYKVFEKHIVPEDHDAVLEAARQLHFTFVRQPDAALKMYVDGEYLGAKLHLEEVGNVASRVSTNGEARRVLTEKMRDVGDDGGVVMEGRDVGTVVFPDAEMKFYLDASAQERAKRRVKQLQEAGEHPDYQKILKLIEERDYRDSHRAVAPLKPAEDAIVIDTSSLNLQQVVDAVWEKIQHYAS
ncbi:(d)CMP kinase [Candidatus Avelusimicrobium gallicola]|uniref:Cytidylate kinase n=1 Tax=Candidatus Avelusimicrobium gallicola TaxID=2562704 RepID=A0A1Y4DHZ1_9BACT|nr:(d)CMP kinase [Elusimicrobium sp. An273]OUO56558.1 cytidylate kinase [Elusimicrobium sp. An273]